MVGQIIIYLTFPDLSMELWTIMVSILGFDQLSESEMIMYGISVALRKKSLKEVDNERIHP